MNDAGLRNGKTKKATFHRHKKQQKLETQLAIRNSLPFTLPSANNPRLHLLEAKYGAKEQARLPDSRWAEWIDKEMDLIPHSSTMTNVAIPNPNYKEDGATPRYAAIRFTNCFAAAEKELLALVREMEEVGIPSPCR